MQVVYFDNMLSRPFYLNSNRADKTNATFRGTACFAHIGIQCRVATCQYGRNTQCPAERFCYAIFSVLVNLALPLMQNQVDFALTIHSDFHS